jgi:alanine-synthesizing transaminase
MFSQRTNWQLTHNRLAEAVERARASGTNLIDLTASNPTRVGLEYQERAILAALSSPNVFDYDPQTKGLLPAREAVVRYYREQHGVENLDPEHVVLTTSTSEGYSYVFRLLCNAGDELLVPKPSYPLFEFLADLQDVKLIPYPLIYDHGWQIDFPSLEKAVTPRTRGVVLVHPNNPTGSYVKSSEVIALNAFCRSHGLALLVDEVFLDYGFNAAVPATFAANREVLTFTLSGLSKISALPQMKVAWIVTTGPEAAVSDAMDRLEVIADTYLSLNAPVQSAIPTMFDERRSIQRQLMTRIKANREELDRRLSEHNDCQRLNIEGGWYAVLRVPVTRTDEELAVELVQQKSVYVHPGHFYDFPNEGYLVLSLINREDEFAEGVSRLLNHLAK